MLGDQCSRGLSALADLDPARDVVLMAEVDAECTYVPHHKKKVVLVLSAMRHFARGAAGRAAFPCATWNSTTPPTPTRCAASCSAPSPPTRPDGWS